MPKYIISFERPDLQQKSCELYLKYSFGLPCRMETSDLGAMM